MNKFMKKLKFGKWVMIGVIVILASVVGIFHDGLLINNKATDIMVIQYPFTGTLKFKFSAGAKWRFWGDVQIYPKSFQFWFDSAHESGMGAIKTRFADASDASFFGGVRITYPLVEEYMRGIHTKYGSHAAVESELVLSIINKAFYNIGPLMTAQESYQDRRPDIIRLAQDMANIGVYQVKSVPTEEADPITGEMKTIDKMVIIKDPASPGGKKRQELSELGIFHIAASNMTISKIAYSNKVLEQIDEQQTAQMDIATAIARSKAARQNTIANIEEGKEKAAKAEAEQNVIKAKAVALAEQLKEVARLARDAAIFTKEKEILLGEGESKRKSLNMEADGALGVKIPAWERVNAKYAEAIGNYQGNWVPVTVMGATGTAVNGADALITLLTAKTARDLALNMTISTKKQVKTVTAPQK